MIRGARLSETLPSESSARSTVGVLILQHYIHFSVAVPNSSFDSLFTIGVNVNVRCAVSVLGNSKQLPCAVTLKLGEDVRCCIETCLTLCLFPRSPILSCSNPLTGCFILYFNEALLQWRIFSCVWSRLNEHDPQ